MICRGAHTCIGLEAPLVGEGLAVELCSGEGGVAARAATALLLVVLGVGSGVSACEELGGS